MSGQSSFLDLCAVLEGISKTKSRLEIRDILSSFFLKLLKEDRESLLPSLFLCSGTIFPQYTNTELGIGEQTILSVVAESSGLTKSSVRKKLVATGDLGIIAMENRVRRLFVNERRLTICEVLDSLRSIAKASGKDSQNAKKRIMLKLLTEASPLESKYMVRLFETKLKVGLALQTILIALGCAFYAEDRRQEDAAGDESGEGSSEYTTVEHCMGAIKEAYAKRPDFEALLSQIFAYGIRHFHEKCTVVPGIPLRPMLAKAFKNLTKAFAKVEQEGFVAEYKYDGERVQLHHSESGTKVFSRNLEDLGLKYPDIAELRLSDKSFILDGEAVAYENGKILPFQILSTRKRKHTGETNVRVCFFVFDILYFDSKELLMEPYSERRKCLFDNFSELEHKFRFAEGKACTSEEEIEVQFNKAVQSSCEGVMIKSLASFYKPSHRTNHWIKIKNDYIDGIGDTLDLVVMGAYYGRGKRTGTYGGFLLGTYNDETGRYETCCKLGTGFSDERLAETYSLLKELETKDISEYDYNSKESMPDIWVAPEVVWEVRAASLSLSPVYVAGISDGRGISLRFPRFIRERKDKKPTEATTSRRLLGIYNDDLNADSEDEFN